ncbi:MAG: FAD-binding oxidoreductase [Deltaproteobacteria bacterium]|nr:FAD-binding oxidoreductase [Deltaproteobacteria bacterium]
MTARLSVQVLVVGGGFAGAATAFFLSRKGIGGVALLEQEPFFGLHASGRNAALCRQLVEDDEVTALTVSGAEVLHSPLPDLSPRPLVSKSGSILLASTEEALAEIQARARTFSLSHELLSTRRVFSYWPLLQDMSCAGAVRFPDDGVIDIHALLHGYLAAARERGVMTFLGCKVERAEPTEQGFLVESNLGTFSARCLVIAAGAWAGSVGMAAGAQNPGLVAYRRHLFLMTQPAGDSRPDLPYAWHLDASFYIRPESAGYLLSPCDETPAEPGDDAVASNAADLVASRVVPLAPRLADLRVARSWACLRTFSPSKRPIIGWDEEVPGLFWVAGLGGHGATASATIGRLAAERIASQLP